MRKAYLLFDGIEATAQQIAREFGMPVVRDEVLRVSSDHTEHLVTRVQRATNHFRPGKIQMPFGIWLPWVETKHDDQTYGIPQGLLFIPRIVVAHLKEFTDEDARANLFTDRFAMREDMKRIYPGIDEKSVGSLYYIDDVLV